MKKNKITFIDLFAGCGGLTEGFLQTGKYKGLAHIEWELPMVNTLRNRLVKKWNHSENDALKRVIHFDMQKSDELINGNWATDSKEEYSLTNHIDVVRNGLKGFIDEEVDVIIGGPPCTAYSLANRGNKYNHPNDYRNFLFESFVNILDYFKPKVFVFENVTGMLSATPGGKLVTERIYQSFEESGYEILPTNVMKRAVLSAADYNVPQNRRRVILIGIQKSKDLSSITTLESIYELLKSHKSKKIKTVREAIYNLPKLTNDKCITHDQNHNRRYHNSRDIDIFREWILNEMNKKTNDEKINYYKLKVGKDTKVSKYRNLEWEKPSPTIVSHLNKDGLMFIHPDPDQARTITVREAALLQSFPEDFDFIENMGWNYKMIGNAVPVNLSKEIAIVLHKSLTSQNSTYGLL